ncbi:MAG TPA: fibronectin type III domain-containing protein, partial [Thermoanaerobaculia bacterium]
PEVIELDPNVASVGTGVFMVHVVYWLAPATDQYTATATSVSAAIPTPTPTPAAPGAPRFVNHYAPPGVMEDAGEPTMGVNWLTENNPRGIATAFKNKFRNGAENQTFNGGTSLYYGGVNNFFLRATFDDCASPALVQWDQVQLTIANAPRAGYDPLLYTDHWTGRTFVLQEFALTPAGSSMEFTDNDGDTMFIAQGGGPSGVDHQTVGGGPLRPDPVTGATPANVITPMIPAGAGPGATPIPNPGATPYPHGVYYASQAIATATSQRSIDGGFSYPQQVPMYTAADCAGLHGHIKIAEDGTAFVPDKACSPAGVPFVLGGNPAVVVSEDNGLTWQVRRVPNVESDAGVDDPSVGVSWCPPGTCSPAEKAERSNHIYMGFMYADGRPGIAYSNNKGVGWQRVVDLGAISNIKHIAFPAVAVGDPSRAAFSFFGTTTAGNYNTPEFPGVWHHYIATTFDFGQTWNIQNVSGNDPIQRGGICGDGTCRNLLDFIDIQIDKQGRVLVAGEDGCIGGCVNGGPNSFTAKAFITRQSGGKRMFQVNDLATTEPAVPGAPQVSAFITGNTRTLSWPEPDNGGSPIVAYKVFRASSALGPFNDTALIATVTQPGYVDSNFPTGNNYYVVTAVNAIGESPYCKEVQAVAGAASPCDLPGVLVSNDLLPGGGDNDSGANTPIDPRV